MFDPYHKWLGIHPDHRPPTHYQLLGISPDEQDREVIEEAAIRQTAHVRTYQLGPHAADCTRILNEIAQARTALLNPAKRKEYDARLAATPAKKTSQTPAPPTRPKADQVTATPAPRPRASAAQVTAVIPVAAADDDFAELGQAPVVPARSAVQRPAIPKWPWFAALGGVGLIVLIAVGALLGYALLRSKPKAILVAEDEGKPPVSVKVAETRAATPMPKPVPDPEPVPDPAPRPVPPPRLDPQPLPDPGPRPDPGPAPQPRPDPEPRPDLRPGPRAREVGRLEGHLWAVSSLAFTPDERYLLSASGTQLWLWDVPTRQVIHRFEGHDMPIQKVVVSPDGRYALTGSGMYDYMKRKPMDCTVRLWDLVQRKLVRRFDGQQTPVKALAFSADGKWFLAGGGVGISQGGQIAAVDCTVRLWQVSGGKPLSFQGQTMPIEAVAFGPNGRILASSNSTVLTWEAQTGKVLNSTALQPALLQGCFYSNGRRLVGWFADSKVRLWAVNPWTEVGTALPAMGFVHTLALSPDGHRALIGQGHTETRDGKPVHIDCRARLLDLDGRSELAHCEGHTGYVLCVALSRKGYAATGSQDRTIRLWDMRQYLHAAPPKPPGVAQKPAELGKATVPDETKLAEAEKLIKDLFKEAYAKRNPTDRLALAAELLDKAKETVDDPVARFVLLREARDLAAQGGDAVAVLAAIDELARGYAVNAFEMKATALAATGRNANTPAANKVLAESYLALIDEALAADDFGAVVHLASLADAAAHKAGNVALLSQVQAREKEVKEIQKESEAVKEAKAKLEQTPDDPGASLAVGRYLCLRKGDWDKGLPLLAHCSDAALMTAAKKDLGQPQDAAAQVEVGDSWWDLGEPRKDSTKTALLARAAHWYREALPELTGLKLAKVEGRLKTIDEQAPAAQTTGAPGELRLLSGHTDRVTSVAMSRDGRRVLSGSEDGTARMWDVETGKELFRLTGISGEVTGVAFCSDDRRALACGPAGLWLCDVKEGRQLWHTHGPPCDSVVVSTENQHVLTPYSRVPIGSWTIEPEGLRPGNSRSDPRWGRITCGTLSPDGSLILLALEEGTVRLIHWGNREEAGRLRNTGIVLGLAQSPNGRTIATAGADKMIRLWDAINGKALRVIKGHRNRVTSVAFSSDGRLLLSGSDDKTVRLWDVRTGRELHTFTVHSDKVTSVAFSADGRRAVSGSDDKTVRVWAVPR
jgi:WD40 repeat protein